jgi:hypothetical protein
LCFGFYTRLEETETWLFAVAKINNEADFLKFYFVSSSIPLHEKIIILTLTGAEGGHFGLLVYGFVCMHYIILVF